MSSFHTKHPGLQVIHHFRCLQELLSEAWALSTTSWTTASRLLHRKKRPANEKKSGPKPIITYQKLVVEEIFAFKGWGSKRWRFGFWEQNGESLFCFAFAWPWIWGGNHSLWGNLLVQIAIWKRMKNMNKKKVPQKHETSWRYHSIILFKPVRTKEAYNRCSHDTFGISRHHDSSNVWKLSNRKWYVLKHDDGVKELQTVLYSCEKSYPQWKLYLEKIQYPRNSRDMYFIIQPLKATTWRFTVLMRKRVRKAAEWVRCFGELQS